MRINELIREMTTNIIEINFEKIYSNLSLSCYNAMEVCQYILQNLDDVPSGLRHEIEQCLIPQTDQLNFISTHMVNPTEDMKRKIILFIERLFKQYRRVLFEGPSYDYVRERIRGNREILRCFEQIAELQQLSVQCPQGGGLALDVIRTPPPSPPQQFQIEDDLPPRSDGSWTDRIWEKACEFISSLVQWLQYAYNTIMSPLTA